MPIQPRNSTVRCFLIYFQVKHALPFRMVAPVRAQKSQPRSSSTRLGAPPLPAIAHYPPRSTHSAFVAPLFSYSYELLSPQPLSFDNDPHCPGGDPLPTLRHSGLPTLGSSKSFASYHIPATPAVSCNYALFCATALRYPSYSQGFPHSFYRHEGGTPAPSVLRP